MSEELKPCPFCGGEADVHYFAHDDSECTVMCSNPNCRASVSARSCGSMTAAYNRARKLWNHRAERMCRIVRARWDDGECVWGCRCTACGDRFTYETGTTWSYCPACGAKVVEEES